MEILIKSTATISLGSALPTRPQSSKSYFEDDRGSERIGRLSAG